MATLVFYLDDGTTMTHALEWGTTTVGRHPDSVIVLDCPSVSGHHAVIELQEDGCLIADQKSSNGTRVNGVEIEEARLNDGDRVGFGDIQAVYYLGEGPAAVEENVVYVPQPEVPAVEAPRPPTPVDYRTRPARRNQAARRVSGYPDQGESGCLTALIVIGLFVAAFITGLYMRHYQATEGGNLFKDLFDKIGGNIPKIKIEQSADKP